MELIKIPFKNRKLFLGIVVILLIGIVLYIIAIFFMILMSMFNLSIKGDDLNHVLFIIRMGVASILVLYIALKIYHNKPALLINDIGVVDNTNKYSSGLIEWNDIAEIELKESSKIILIKVKDAQKYISRAEKKAAYLLKNNTKKFKTPFIINLRVVKYNTDELMSVLQEQFKKNE